MLKSEAPFVVQLGPLGMMEQGTPADVSDSSITSGVWGVECAGVECGGVVGEEMLSVVEGGGGNCGRRGVVWKEKVPL